MFVSNVPLISVTIGRGYVDV